MGGVVVVHSLYCVTAKITHSQWNLKKTFHSNTFCIYQLLTALTVILTVNCIAIFLYMFNILIYNHICKTLVVVVVSLVKMLHK